MAFPDLVLVNSGQGSLSDGQYNQHGRRHLPIRHDLHISTWLLDIEGALSGALNSVHWHIGTGEHLYGVERLSSTTKRER
jgi:hypothetical protein